MSVMNTFSGKKFDPMHMNSEDVSLEDLAHALSLLCRGGGHLKYFYSVGQHSINCMKEARARGWSKRVQLACLLHDASEAYIADIIRPVKAHLPEYYKIESKIMTCIFDKFGLDDLSEEENSRWKQLDDEILDHGIILHLIHDQMADTAVFLLGLQTVFQIQNRIHILITKLSFFVLYLWKRRKSLLPQETIV